MLLQVYSSHHTPLNPKFVGWEIPEGARAHIRNTFRDSYSGGEGLQARSLQDTCPSGSPLVISSSLFPSADGCYLASDTLLSGEDEKTSVLASQGRFDT